MPEHAPLWARLPVVGNLGYPIALKEVRALLRRNRYFWVQFVYLIILAAGVLITIVAEMGDVRNYQEVSRTVTDLFFVIQGFLVLLVFPAFASTAVSSERVEKSFDLLATTDLKPAEIVWGKFLGIFGNCCYFLLVTLPILGTCILFGGAPVFDAMFRYGLLVVMAAMLTVYGLMISAWARSNIRAILMTYAPVLILTVFVTMALEAISFMGRLPNAFDVFQHPIVVLDAVVVLSLIFAFCFVAAVQLLTSEEGNRATPMRILILVGVVSFIVLVALNIPQSTAQMQITGRHLADYFEVVAGVGLGVLAPLLICLSGGRTETPLRVVQQSQRNPGRMYAAWLLLPGGLRGLFYSVAVCGLLAVALLYFVEGYSSELAGVAVSSVPGLTKLESFRHAWTLVAVAIVTYCSLAFLVSALGVRGPLNLVIVVGFVVLANLYAAVLEQSAQHPDDVYLRPLSILVTLSQSNYMDRFDFATYSERVELALLVHGCVAVVLALAGCVVMKINKIELFGMRLDPRLGLRRPSASSETTPAGTPESEKDAEPTDSEGA